MELGHTPAVVGQSRGGSRGLTEPRHGPVPAGTASPDRSPFQRALGRCSYCDEVATNESNVTFTPAETPLFEPVTSSRIVWLPTAVL